MNIIQSVEFDRFWKNSPVNLEDEAVSAAARRVIEAVRLEGDAAVRRFAAEFDKSSPQTLEVPPEGLRNGYQRLRETEPALTEALETAADSIRRFARRQKAQCTDFEYETAPGLIAGQRVLPVQRAGVYVPAGRFPLISSALMGAIPALEAGVPEVILFSPPLEDGLPDWRILGAARLAGVHRVFAIGGAQGIAAAALGTETVPGVDVIVGPGNKYVAAAKRLLFGEAGIDFIAGPTDVLIIADGVPDPESRLDPADAVAADLLAQAEHDPDARARALVPTQELGDRVMEKLQKRLARLPTASIAQASLDAGGLIVIYDCQAEAVRIANAIAPEHLELQTQDPDSWIPGLRNYGSLFIGSLAAEVLGDYTAGINHTLPTLGSARFSGGLSVRHFLKVTTSLRCNPAQGWERALAGAALIAQAEGLAAHKASAADRLGNGTPV
jgi:histidinol dehydrogenase